MTPKASYASLFDRFDVPTLEGKGPSTVVAPTNEAFAALPAGTVDTLLKPENKKALDKVLNRHCSNFEDIHDNNERISFGVFPLVFYA